MKSGLCIFNTDHLDDIRAHGFSIVRIDLQRDGGSLVADRINTIQRAGLKPLVILRETWALDYVPEGVDVELGNEPDLEHEGWTVDSYRERCEEFIAHDRGRHRLWFGAVSNLNDRGFNFLSELPWDSWGPDINCSVHRYPEASGPVLGHDRLTRDEEIERLTAIVGERPLGLSEIGYAAEWTETEQSCHYAWEREFFTLHGFAFAVAYQIGSSETDTYGFRRDDGTWKPCTKAWTHA
jgi:hypothetical protein